MTKKKLSLFLISYVLSVSPPLLMVLKRLFLPFVPILILLLALTACDTSVPDYDADSSYGFSSSLSFPSSQSSVAPSAPTSSSRSSSVASSTASRGSQAYEGHGCMIGGCSGQICSNEDDEPVVSTCIWTAAYACYQTARCEKQASGSCGWTQSSELQECLAKAN